MTRTLWSWDRRIFPKFENEHVWLADVLCTPSAPRGKRGTPDKMQRHRRAKRGAMSLESSCWDCAGRIVYSLSAKGTIWGCALGFCFVWCWTTTHRRTLFHFSVQEGGIDTKFQSNNIKSMSAGKYNSSTVTTQTSNPRCSENNREEQITIKKKKKNNCNEEMETCGTTSSSGE